VERSVKEKTVADLRERLGSAYGIFVVDYQGLKVEELTRLRRELKGAEVEFQVVKNKLLGIACQDTDAAVLTNHLTGPCALAVTYDDVVGPAKILTKFSQDYEKLEIKVAQIRGNIVEVPAIKRLAQLPTREVLISQVLFALSGVPTSFVRLLSEMLRRMITVLEAIKRQKGSG
jgi:large subunit ribosomal protein L10